MQVQGVLSKISSKQGTGANGKPWTAYSLGVDNGDGSLTWYRSGFDKPEVTEGSYVKFSAKETKPGIFTVDGDVAVDKSRRAEKAVQAASVSSDTRQNSIVRQNATSTAALIVNNMVTAGVVKLPAKGKAFDAYLELVQDVANRIFLVNIDPPTPEELKKQYGEATNAEVEAEDTDDYWAEE